MSGSTTTGAHFPRHESSGVDVAGRESTWTELDDEPSGRPWQDPTPGDDGPGTPAVARRGLAGRLHRGLSALTARAFGLDRPLRLPAAGHRARWLFAVAALTSVAYQLLTNSRMIFGGVMWAEMGTNYYTAATSGSLRTQLFATDSGYIPLPQRLIALLGQEFGVPGSVIPYFYTGAAVLLSALLFASVCLPAFRPVIPSDGLRFVLAIGLTVVPDFETRTFINFTYFALVFASLVTALALVRRDGHVPAAAWVLPVLMLSKPAVLAILPAIVVAAILTGGRFRRIAAASVVAGAVQLGQLVVSASSGNSLLQDAHASLASKVVATAGYAFGWLGRMTVDPGATLHRTGLIAAAAIVLLLSAAVLVFGRSRAAALVAIGLSLVLFTALIDCFTFSAVFTTDFSMMHYPVFDRRFYGAMTGVLLVVAGIVAAVVDGLAGGTWVRQAGRRLARLRLDRGAGPVAVVLFCVWFTASGWLHYSTRNSSLIPVPVSGSSQWSTMGRVLDTGEPVVCIPEDPFGWVYGRNCVLLTPMPTLPPAWADVADDDSGTTSVTVRTPASVQRGALASLAVAVRPGDGRLGEVDGTATLTAADGSTTRLRARAQLPADGGLLQFWRTPTPVTKNVRSVQIQFDQPVSVGAAQPADPATAVVLWMGMPGA